MADNTHSTSSPQTWSQLIDALHQNGFDDRISILYAHSAEENGNQFEGLQQQIRQALGDLHANTSLTETIFQDAPFMVSEHDSPQHIEQENEQHNANHGYIGGGSLINHEKYESDILDKLGQQHQQAAIDELNGIRSGNGYTDQQKKEIEEIQNNTKLSGEAKKQLLETYKKDALEQKFREILERNATAEDTLQEQHELLAKQLEESQKDTPLRSGEISAAERVRLRAIELRDERAEERNEFSKIDKQEMEALSKQKHLTVEQRSKLERYHYLQQRNSWERRSALSQKDIEGWVKRFSNCKTKEEQDALMHKLLARQQRRTRNEVWKVFNQNGKGRFSGLYKKTLSRKERRNLLNYQKAHLPAQRPKFLPRILPKRFAQIEYLPNQHPDLQQYYEDDDEGGSGLFGRIKKAYDTFKNIKNLFGGGGAAAPTAAAPAAAGAGVGGAGAAGGIGIGTVGIILLVVGLLVAFVVFVMMTHQQQQFSTQLIELQCGDLKDIPVQDNTTLMEQVFAKRFGAGQFPVITPVGDQTDPTVETVSVKQEERMYSTVCVLFGHILGDVYQDPNKPSQFNTFGTSVVGSQDQRKGLLSGDSKLAFFQLLISVKGDDTKKCSIEYEKKQGDDPHPTYYWAFHHPETCSDGQFQFLIAQWLGHASVIQQEHLKQQKVSINDVYTPFKNTPDAGGIIGEDGLLPTNNCSNSTNYGENAKDQQTRDCYADMVGAYLTYPFYFDGNPSLQPPCSAPSVTPPSGGSAPTTSPLCNFPTNQYHDYYSFAHDILFDGQDLVIASGSGDLNGGLAGIATYVANQIDKDPCGGLVITANLSCIIRSGLTALEVYWIKTSVTTTTGLLQCVGFVQAVTAQFGTFIGRGNAYEFAGRSIPGYQWMKNAPGQIAIGDIPIWQGTGVCGGGHIAVVTKLFGSKGFGVAQATGQDGKVYPATFYDYRGFIIKSTLCPLLGWQRKL